MTNTLEQADVFMNLYHRIVGPKNVAVEVDTQDTRNLTFHSRQVLVRILKTAQLIKASRSSLQAKATLYVRFGEGPSVFNSKDHTLTIYISDFHFRVMKCIKLFLVFLFVILTIRTLCRMSMRQHSPSFAYS